MYYLNCYRYSQYLVDIYYMRFLNLLNITYVYINVESSSIFIFIFILLFFTLINIKKLVNYKREDYWIIRINFIRILLHISINRE